MTAVSTVETAGLALPVVRDGRWPAVRDPRLLAFLRHWAKARQGGLVPRRSAFDPVSLPRCMPNMLLQRYDPHTRDFVCTVAGEELRQAWGMSLIGKRLHDYMPADVADSVRLRNLALLEIPAIVHGGHRLVRDIVNLKHAERIFTPLFDDDGTPHSIVGMAIFDYDPVTQAEAPVKVTGDDAVLFDCHSLPATLP